MDVELWKYEFYKYYCNFDVNEEAIVRKYNHSIRVMNLAKQLAIYNNFTEEEIKVATLIGLLHDIARFLQWTNYKTYSDLDSVDHGDLGVKILFEDDEISKYITDKKYYDVIYNAIKYHNKYSFPDDLSDDVIKFCKLIRDCDKLDIFYILGSDYNIFKDDDSDLSLDLVDEFYRGKLLKREMVKSCNDRILLELAMIFDLNYIYSYDYIYKNKLIWKIYDKLNNKDKFYDYFIFCDNYIKNKLFL